MSAPIVKVRDLVKDFQVTRGRGGPPAVLPTHRPSRRKDGELGTNLAP